MTKLFALPTWALALAVLVPLVSALPLFVGYASSAPPEKIFMGFDFIDDFHYYGNYIYTYAHEPLDLFIENRVTSEEQKGVFFFPLFWVMGILSNWVGIPLALALVRFVVCVLLFVLLWHVLGHFIRDEFWKKTAYALCALGSGIGWLFWVGGFFVPALARLYSTDLTYSLGYSLFGYLTFPLAMAGQTIFLGMVLVFLSHANTPTWRNKLVFAFLGVLLFFVHPISFLTFIPVFGVWALLSFLEHPSHSTWKKIVEWVPSAVLVAAPILLYLAWAFTDEVFRATFFSYGLWLRSESPFWWLIGYGLLLVLGTYGLRHARFEEPRTRALFWAWLLVILVLSLNPWKGLRFQHALFIPMVVLATFGLKAVSEYYHSRFPTLSVFQPRTMVALLLLLTLPSILLTAYMHVQDVTNPEFHSGPYLSGDEIDAIRFLETQPKGIVLSSYKSGNNLAWMTPHRTYLGHWNQTIDAEDKRTNVEYFFSGAFSTNEVELFLEEEKINYVFYGSEEKEWNENNSLSGAGTLLYSNDTVHVYGVRP